MIATQTFAAAQLREDFEGRNWVRIEGFLDSEKLERTERAVEDGKFDVIDHNGLKTELVQPADQPAYPLLYWMTNDPELFELVREASGCNRIGCFTGRVYRMLPGPEGEDSWHDDLVKNRMVAMSVNLGHEPYEGGALELRDAESKQILDRIPNTGPGDALLFRLDRSLEHRVTAVNGEVPKTAYAGWFRSEPESELLDPAALLARDRDG